MVKRGIVALVIAAWLPWAAAAEEQGASKFQALKCPAVSLGQTWGIIDRNGAGAKVEPYLSSLTGGEAGTGMISSPPFIIAVDKITFTVCGHDGQQAGRNENCIVLVDARKGNVLLTTPPPGTDALQERSWDVKGLRGTEVRIELRDKNSGSAFAWFGVGRVDAGPGQQIDFRQGMPQGWAEPERAAEVKYELLSGAVPFKRIAQVFSIIPKQGAVEIACGFSADGLYFLGCTVSGGRPLQTYGGIEVHYREGSPEVFPLMCGFSLDAAGKLLSPSPALRLHASADPYQHYLAIQPRGDVIEKIRLVTDPNGPLPRITAITCRTQAKADSLMPLPATEMDADEAAWLDAHILAAGKLNLDHAAKAIRAAHKMPAADSGVQFRRHQLDKTFRSEGVAVADFNGDGQLDIAAGNVYYAGPTWKLTSTAEKPGEFNRYGYSDAFLCYADDVTGDGAIDLVEVGFPGKETHWLENPGRSGGFWKKHLAVALTGNENPAYLDADGDGRRELVFMSEGKCAFAQPGADPRQPWKIKFISKEGEPSAAHGLGVEDVNRDGRLDVLIPDGWWEGPASKSDTPWVFHPAKFFGGAQLCVDDFDGDGDTDVLGSSPHAYGISWTEQTPDGWQIHEIDSISSQTHAIKLADLNGDGLPDFVTGKRFWAHNGHDPGSYLPSELCWYELQRRQGKPQWTKHIIDLESGVGLHFEIVDVNGDQRLDIVTSNKNGVFYFEQTAGG